MSRPKKYPDELVQRGIRLALESERPIAEVARDLGMHPEALRKRIRQHEADSGARPDLPTSSEREEIRKLRAEKSASVVFREGVRRGPNEVSRYVDEHRGSFGVEPICRVLGVSASAYHHRATWLPVDSGHRGRAAARADPRNPRRELLRLRLPADLEGAAQSRRVSISFITPLPVLNT